MTSNSQCSLPVILCTEHETSFVKWCPLCLEELKEWIKRNDV